jgi:hypothetical protein
LEAFAGVWMVTEIMKAMRGGIESHVVFVWGFMELGHELLGGNGGIGVVIIFLVEIGERFAEVFYLEIWGDGPEIEGVDLDRANKAR